MFHFTSNNSFFGPRNCSRYRLIYITSGLDLQSDYKKNRRPLKFIILRLCPQVIMPYLFNHAQDENYLPR
ncbi:MAG: hypothetical protein B5M54_02160 [Candidatus Aminicenantes bacterium 4484_214]|nr:MAG: hypothetical protein B5M54_02160 [Candidatus Aminicenantes bacterium 4484_214]